jgi:hypothetical protein
MARALSSGRSSLNGDDAADRPRDRVMHVPVNWLIATLGLLSSGLLVAIIVLLQSSGQQGALSATAMALAVISFGAQLLLAAVGYLTGIRQEERSSVIHRQTVEAIQTLRLAIESNVSATSSLSDRFNTDFQTMLDHVLATSAQAATGPHEVRLIEEIGSDLREKALEVAVSVPNSPRSRLASRVVKLLHESRSTVANSVSYTRGVISWLSGSEPSRFTAIVSDTLATPEEIDDLARRAILANSGESQRTDQTRCYIIFPVKPYGIVGGLDVSGVEVTWIDEFAAEIAKRDAGEAGDVSRSS